MRICILAVTKARWGEYCIAGMTDEGQWVRPIPQSGQTRFWNASQLTSTQYGFLRSGDIIEFNGLRPAHFQHPNHTEDMEVQGNFQVVNRYSNDQLMRFLREKEENEAEFLSTVNAQNRSLCLIKVDEFITDITQFPGDSPKPKINLTKNEFDVNNPLTNNGNYIVKDCKWSNLILNNALNEDLTFNDIYIAIGLATKWGPDSIEYPQIIGVHGDLEVRYPDTYPD